MNTDFIFFSLYLALQIVSNRLRLSGGSLYVDTMNRLLETCPHTFVERYRPRAAAERQMGAVLRYQICNQIVNGGI